MIIDSIIPNSDKEKKIKSLIKKLGKKKKITIMARMKNDLIEYLKIEMA
tara:strand:+ start:574 stop:720 length:147 start_codon:yes stop_codon:yes gene_type:complete